MTKSARNKTIDFDLDHAPQAVLEQIATLQPGPVSLAAIRDRSINGDSFQVVRQFPDRFADLALVDPPYNLDKRYDGLNFKHQSTGEYQEYTQRWIDLIKPKLTPTASLYVFADWQTSVALAPVLAANFTVKNRITWQREKGRGAKGNWKNGMEDIWFLTMDEREYTFNVDQVKLAKLILASSNPGDLVLDPFAGAGSSLVTAKKLDRHFVGIEQSRLYTAWGVYRLQAADHDRSIQGYTDGVFWERNTGALQRRLNKKKG